METRKAIGKKSVELRHVFEQISRIDKLFRLNKENKGLKQNYKWEKLSNLGARTS